MNNKRLLSVWWFALIVLLCVGYWIFHSFSKPKVTNIPVVQIHTAITNPLNATYIIKGVEVTLNKRLSNKWMTRIGFAYNDWVDNVGAGAIQNPTADVHWHTVAIATPIPLP